jgi:hypothetical protein
MPVTIAWGPAYGAAAGSLLLCAMSGHLGGTHFGLLPLVSMSEG